MLGRKGKYQALGVDDEDDNDEFPNGYQWFLHEGKDQQGVDNSLQSLDQKISALYFSSLIIVGSASCLCIFCLVIIFSSMTSEWEL